MSEWRGIRLKDLGRWSSGGTPPRDREDLWEGDLPWLSAKDIDSTRLREPTAFITEEAARAYSRTLPADALLLIVRGMALAHGLPVVRTVERSAFNQDLRGLECGPFVDARFAHYALIGNRWRLNRHIDRAAHGTARVIDSIYAERIPVPNRETQRSITDFLDRECARIGELRSELAALLTSLANTMSEAVSAALRDRPEVPLRFRLRGIDQGWSPECEARTAEPGEWGVLKVGCVNYGRFRADEHKRLPDDVAPRPSAEVRVGDMLMSRANTRDLVGSVARVDDLGGRRLMLSDKHYRLRPTADLDSEFATLVLNSRRVRGQIEIGTAGASSSMQNISLALVRGLRIPDVSLAEQSKIVAALHRTRARNEAAATETRALIGALEEYRDALITDAVTGKLAASKLGESRMAESLDAVREGERPEVLSS